MCCCLRFYSKKRDSNNNNNRSPKFEYYNFTKFVITIEALKADMGGLDGKKIAQFGDFYGAHISSVWIYVDVYFFVMRRISILFNCKNSTTANAIVIAKRIWLNPFQNVQSGKSILHGSLYCNYLSEDYLDRAVRSGFKSKWTLCRNYQRTGNNTNKTSHTKWNYREKKTLGKMLRFCQQKRLKREYICLKCLRR